ncbi:hypothetical protein [Dictyobacter aurantiacus]|uniref:Uncharacterized protein n=1 Tax=Dictyobacter aurantiacus TaxID=1936993 RepID=A0A401ZDJ0_9CHLR|nr:hypothetical protein [Dictyobacter aurantiacus]GCE04909.1 hypothetical protein KDAU_22380 [Dictyobacter aurantiacus]
MISQNSSYPDANANPPSSAAKRNKQSHLFALISLVVLIGIAGGTFVSLNFTTLKSAFAADPSTAVVTFKGDNSHTGNYSTEKTLNLGNVNPSKFGKRMSYQVDGQVYAQPLFLPNLTVNGTTHNVVLVETEHDTVYAFDADQTDPNTPPLWKTSFLVNGATSPSYMDIGGCNDMKPEVGLSGTPVIDQSTGTMYVVAMTNEGGNLVYRIHALDVTTGHEKPGSPQVISGSVPGTGSATTNGRVPFQPKYERQRSALMLANGQVYISFGSFCDFRPYHGWIISYSYNGSNLTQTHIYNDTANGNDGGIWASGGPLSTDASGNIYYVSGNGDFTLNTGGTSGGDSIVKLSPDLSKVLDYFSPFNQQCLQEADADLGSGGLLFVQTAKGPEIIQGGKEGRIYVLNPNSMGKFTNDPNLNCTSTSTERNRTDIDKVVQELPPNTTGGIYSNPAYWNGNVYIAGAREYIKAFKFSTTTGLLTAPYSSRSPETSPFTGGNPVISSNGTQAGTGILWSISPGASNGTDFTTVLRAYDATNIGNEIYNSETHASQDRPSGTYVKFSTPIVANGEVFVGTKSSLDIYGLFSGTPTPTPTPGGTPIATPTPGGTPTPTPTPAPGGPAFNNVGISTDTNPGSANFDNAHNSYSDDLLRSAGINAGDNTFYNPTGMVFTWPNAVPGSPDNYVAAGQTLSVDSVPNANILGFLGSASGGPSYGKATINYVDGTTQSFTLGFSDWTLGGGKSPISFGNGTLTSLPYRNTPNGFQLVTNYVFYTDVAIQPGKAVKSVTLPSKVTGGAMHVFAVATKEGPTPTTPVPAVPYNNAGATDDNNLTVGNLDGKYSYSFQASQMQGLIPGVSVNAYGGTFTWPVADAGQNNNYIANGQIIPVTPVSNAQTLAFLGAATNGDSRGTATITYDDGTTAQAPLRFNDWTLSAGNESLFPGVQIAVSMPYRNFSGGHQTLNNFVFYTEIGLAAGKTIKSVTLPSDTTGGQMHIFSITTKSSAPFTPVSANNAGTTDDNHPGITSLDGKYSYSAQALKQSGLAPGSVFTYNSTSFIWPGGIAQNNNYAATGQVVPVNAVNGATSLAFLASAHGGPTSGTITITYANGTTEQDTVNFSDWTLVGGTQQLSSGNTIATTQAYRNFSGGRAYVKNYVYYIEVGLRQNLPVVSVTLPNNNHIHIFAVGTR